MDSTKYASIESQLGNEACLAEDTEEMFWLRESDDYQSCVALGNALAGQYRFKEAAESYRKAELIKSDDAMLYIRMGGAYLSLYRYEEAEEAYKKAVAAGASSKAVAYPRGISFYLKKDYAAAAEEFKNCLPAGGEMTIAIIYWHTLCAISGNFEATLLKEYDPSMDVGHHKAYKTAVDVFAGLVTWSKEQANEDIFNGTNPLDSSIIQYGLSVYLRDKGLTSEAESCLDEALKNEIVWPSVAYLAAWADKHTTPEK